LSPVGGDANRGRQVFTAHGKKAMRQFEMHPSKTPCVPYKIEYFRLGVYCFLVQFIKNKDLAEDLTQDVILKVWSKYERISSVADIDNYILKMAKHHVIDHFKKLAREKIYQQEVWYHMQKSTNPVESKLLQKYIDSRLDAIVKALPERQQEVYILSKREGLSLDEIASTLGITVRTARNHLGRALKVIQRSINKDSFRLWILAVLGYFID